MGKSLMALDWKSALVYRLNKGLFMLNIIAVIAIFWGAWFLSAHSHERDLIAVCKDRGELGMFIENTVIICKNQKEIEHE